MPAPSSWQTVSAVVRNAVDFDGAPIGRRDAAEDFHQRRLAGAVFSDEADNLARAYLHAEIGERHDAGIGFAQAPTA